MWKCEKSYGNTHVDPDYVTNGTDRFLTNSALELCAKLNEMEERIAFYEAITTGTEHKQVERALAAKQPAVTVPVEPTAVQHLTELLANCRPPWWRRWFPFLPSIIRVPALRLTIVQLWDCSYTAIPIGKPHFVDALRVNHRRWWQPPWCGFQVWI